MLDKPFEKVSVIDIAERAGLSRKSFYNHFRDKYDLINWICYSRFVEIRADAFSDDIRALERLRKRVFDAVKQIIGLSPKISLVEPGSLPRSEGKIKRVIDNRRK